MGYTVKYLDEEDYVYVSVSGQLNVEVAKKIIAEWLAVSNARKCKKVLTDFTQVHVNEQIVVMYEFSGNMDKVGITRDMRMAALVSDELEKHRFFETVAKNRGFNYRNFLDKEDAVKWLKDKD